MAGSHAQKAHEAELLGVSMKTISLLTLTVQNSALILILYYSRVMPLVGGMRYITSTAVFLNEVLKLVVCLTMALHEISSQVTFNTTATSLFTNLFTSVFTGDSWKLAIPATLYTLQNSLQYVAISHLDAATLQVTYQFKILPTAIFSVLILGRSLSARQWAALALLMFGVAIVQLPTTQPASSMSVKGDSSHWRFLSSLKLPSLGRGHQSGRDKRSTTYQDIEEDHATRNPPRNELIGLLAALGACTVSALGSVYFERVVKHATATTGIWVRNVQLSFYSLFPAFFVGVIFVDGEAIAKHGFFAGYNWVVWAVVSFQAMGGIIVALCVYYADTVTKSFATSISILLSLIMSMMLFDFNLSINFFVGTAIVLYATYLYNAEAQRRQPRSMSLSENEKTLNFAIKLPPDPSKESGYSVRAAVSPSLHRALPGSSRDYFGVKKD